MLIGVIFRKISILSFLIDILIAELKREIHLYIFFIRDINFTHGKK